MNKSNAFIKLLMLASFILLTYSTVLAEEATIGKESKGPTYYYLHTESYAEDINTHEGDKLGEIDFKEVTEVGSYGVRNSITLEESTPIAPSTKVTQKIRVSIMMDRLYTYYKKGTATEVKTPFVASLHLANYSVDCELDANSECTLTYSGGKKSIGPFALDGPGQAILLSSGFLSASNKSDYLCSLLTNGIFDSAYLCGISQGPAWTWLDSAFNAGEDYDLTTTEFAAILSKGPMTADVEVVSDQKTLYRYVIPGEKKEDPDKNYVYEVNTDPAEVCFEESINGNYYDTSCSDERGDYRFGCVASPYGDPNYAIVALGLLAIAFYYYRRRKYDNY